MQFTRIRRLAVTGSTNDDVAKILGEPEARGLTIVADFQTGGSGRKGRAWIAPPGSALLFTTALPDPIPARDLWIVPFWIGLCVHDVLASINVTTTLQWPNDVLLNGRKLAGILCISKVTGDEAWAACGVGINVQRPLDGALLAGITPPPAFVSDVATFERDALLSAILERADQSLALLRDTDAVARRWEAAAGVPGARYELLPDGSNESFAATAMALAAGGALVVSADGCERSIAAGDARVLR